MGIIEDILILLDMNIFYDLYYVNMKGLHRHNYERIKDGETLGVFWQRHQCTGCKKIVGLDDWQISDLPLNIKYEKIDTTINRRD